MKYKMLLLVLLFSACKKRKELPIEIVGHAGMGMEFSGSIYHSNSEEAIDLALENNGLDGVEMDVRLAADGTLWLCHDETLESETKGKGCVENNTETELKSVKYKSVNGEKLAKLEDVEQLLTSNKNIFLDIKNLNYCENSVQNVGAFLDALAFWSEKNASLKTRTKVIVSTASWVEPFSKKGWKVLFSSSDVQEISTIFKKEINVEGVVIRNKSCTKEQVSQWRKEGKEVFIFEVRSPKALKEVRRKEPTGVMSDDVQGAIIEFK